MIELLLARGARHHIFSAIALGDVSDRFEDGDQLVFAHLTLGNGEFTLSPGGEAGPRDVRLWFFTDRVEELYRALKARQVRAAHAALADVPSDEPEVWFEEDLYRPFYGGRQFSVRDLNGLELIFWQPDWMPAAT